MFVGAIESSGLKSLKKKVFYVKLMRWFADELFVRELK